MGPVSQLWPFVPRAFGPSSKGIGFAEANDDTSTSSGAGSACCWRRATGVKKYCGHLIIDSLFLHYGRAQRPQLRLRPLCTHHTGTHKGRQSLPRRAWPRMGSTAGPSTTAHPGPTGTTEAHSSAQDTNSKDASYHFPIPHLHRGITNSGRETVPWLQVISRLLLHHPPCPTPVPCTFWMGQTQLLDDWELPDTRDGALPHFSPALSPTRWLLTG